MFCRHCQHDLRVSTNSRCPECGEWFSPKAPWTYWAELPPARGGRWWADRISTWLVVATIVGAIGWFVVSCAIGAYRGGK